MGSYLWRTEGVNITTGPTTFTHGLGVAPAGEDGHVFVQPLSAWGITVGGITVVSSNSNIVVLAGIGATVQANILVMAFHSIIK